MDAQSIIKDTYKTYFGRDPEQGGLDHWMKQAEGMGGNLSGLSDKIIGSAQGNDRSGVINKAYSDMFGRTAEQGGMDHWNSFWDKNWTGNNTKNDIWTTIGATSSGNDEKALADRLTSGNASWMTPFKDPAKADTYWQNLNDKDGALTGAATGTGTQTGGMDIAALMQMLKAAQGSQQTATPAPTMPSAEGYQKFMNPFLEEVYKPAARQVSDTYSRRIGDLKGAATQAGAYGDDTYGDAYATLAGDEAQALSDLAANIFGQGFDTSMNRWQQQQGIDLQALGLGSNIDLANRQFDLESLLSMDQNQQNWISTMLGLDNYSRTWDQAAKDREYQDFWNKQMWPIYLQNLGVSWAGGVPSNQQTITTETRPGNSLISNLGAWFNA